MPDTQMSEATRITDELTRAVAGDPWHGDSVSAILRGVSAAAARQRPHANVHTIWEIVRHMTAWTSEVTRRLDGNRPALPTEGDWPAPNGTSDDDWRRDVTALSDAHQQLLEKVSTFADGSLHTPPPDIRDRPAGSGVTHYVLLHGLAQHHAYHAGQIAVLKKMATGT